MDPIQVDLDDDSAGDDAKAPLVARPAAYKIWRHPRLCLTDKASQYFMFAYARIHTLDSPRAGRVRQTNFKKRTVFARGVELGRTFFARGAGVCSLNIRNASDIFEAARRRPRAPRGPAVRGRPAPHGLAQRALRVPRRDRRLEDFAMRHARGRRGARAARLTLSSRCHVRSVCVASLCCSARVSARLVACPPAGGASNFRRRFEAGTQVLLHLPRRPKKATPPPVVLWIHGGGFTFGEARDVYGANVCWLASFAGAEFAWASVEHADRAEILPRPSRGRHSKFRQRSRG